MIQLNSFIQDESGKKIIKIRNFQALFDKFTPDRIHEPKSNEINFESCPHRNEPLSDDAENNDGGSFFNFKESKDLILNNKYQKQQKLMKGSNFMTINLKMKSGLRQREESSDEDHDTEAMKGSREEKITFENFVQPLFKVEKCYQKK